MDQLSSNVAAIVKPGWVILVLGVGGYLLSETRIIGPLLAILLALGTIFQLNQWQVTKGLSGQSLI